MENPVFTLVIYVPFIRRLLVRPAIPNSAKFAMSDKETTRNETPWRARGFKKPFQGTKYQEFIDCDKTFRRSIWFGAPRFSRSLA